ncbi:uncharacterized protein KRP23_9618 [Phytophthora ramorum]|uniref:uncharacterized protein n=1 Tax=Phytophthora ramorum TaxID=164328 RepID=UPI00309CFBFB|nr:hypothetical protein KRP23_9618 [Phytophthora ramorum]
MRLLSLLLIAALTLGFTTTNALPAIAPDQSSISKPLDVSRDSKTLSRNLKTVNEDDEEDQEEERGGFNFGSLTKLFKSSSKTKKAAQAALAAEKQKNFEMYGKILEHDHILHPAMATWRAEGSSATKIYNEMIAAGRTVDEAGTVFMRYSTYLQDMMHTVKTAKDLEISQMRQMFKDIVKSDDALYNSMAQWRKDGVSASWIYHQMTTIGGRPVGEANSVRKSYSNYLKRMLYKPE